MPKIGQQSKLQTAKIQMWQLIMSCLSLIYTVYNLIFEFSIWQSLDETFFLLNFADMKFVFCCFGALKVNSEFFKELPFTILVGPDNVNTKSH